MLVVYSVLKSLIKFRIIKHGVDLGLDATSSRVRTEKRNIYRDVVVESFKPKEIELKLYCNVNIGEIVFNPKILVGGVEPGNQSW